MKKLLILLAIVVMFCMTGCTSSEVVEDNSTSGEMNERYDSGDLMEENVSGDVDMPVTIEVESGDVVMSEMQEMESGDIVMSEMQGMESGDVVMSEMQEMESGEMMPSQATSSGDKMLDMDNQSMNMKTM